jgi:hypothetical protein
MGVSLREARVLLGLLAVVLREVDVLFFAVALLRAVVPDFLVVAIWVFALSLSIRVSLSSVVHRPSMR